MEKKEEAEDETVVVSQRIKDMLAELRPEEAVGLAVEKVDICLPPRRSSFKALAFRSTKASWVKPKRC